MYFDDFDDSLLSAKRSKFTKKELNIAKNPFDDLSDEELLETPAHLLANQLRKAANNGHELKLGDNCATRDAVYRIPDGEGTQLDYHPFLDDSKIVEHPAGLISAYPINKELANQAIPPRVVEPTLPPTTKPSKLDVIGGKMDLSPIEQKIIKAYTVLQIVNKAGGDYLGLAYIFDNLWGLDNFFLPTERYDFIGDFTAQRYMSIGTKIRFQWYRNVGWTSIVNAGVSQATLDHFGPNAVINWQRRTDLARLYIDIAIMLEGGVKDLHGLFAITCRIPWFTVNRINLEDLSLKVNGVEMKKHAFPKDFSEIIERFKPKLLDETMRMLSISVRAKSGADIDYYKLREEILEPSHAYDKLGFVRPLVDSLIERERTLLQKSELVIDITQRLERHTVMYSKSQDFYTAILESYTATSMLDSGLDRQVVQVITTMAEISHRRKHLPKQRAIKFSIQHHHILDELIPYINATINRLLDPNEIKLKTKYERILGFNTPREIWNLKETVPRIQASMLYVLLTQDDGHLPRSVHYYHKQLKEKMKQGLKAASKLEVTDSDDFFKQASSSIHNTTMRFYRQRYRARGRVCKLLADQLWTVQDTKAKKEMVDSICWDLLANLVGAVRVTVKDRKCSIYYDNDWAKKSLIIAKSQIATSLNIYNPYFDTHHMYTLLSDLSSWAHQNQIQGTNEGWMSNPFDEVWAQFGEYMALHEQDYKLELPVHHTKAEERKGTEIDMSAVLQFTAANVHYEEDIREVAFAHIIVKSNANTYLDVEDIDNLRDVFMEKILPNMNDINNYCQSLLSIDDTELAETKVSEWLALNEEQQERDIGSFEIDD